MRFRELDVWKRSYLLSKQVYALMTKCRDYGFKDQICRSSVSVISNIAESSERGNNKDYIRFLYLSKGSCAELYTQLMTAKDFGYMSAEQANELLDEADQVNKMIGGYIKYLSKNI